MAQISDLDVFCSQVYAYFYARGFVCLLTGGRPTISRPDPRPFHAQKNLCVGDPPLVQGTALPKGKTPPFRLHFFPQRRTLDKGGTPLLSLYKLIFGEGPQCRSAYCCMGRHKFCIHRRNNGAGDDSIGGLIIRSFGPASISNGGVPPHHPHGLCDRLHRLPRFICGLEGSHGVPQPCP